MSNGGHSCTLTSVETESATLLAGVSWTVSSWVDVIAVPTVLVAAVNVSRASGETPAAPKAATACWTCC